MAICERCKGKGRILHAHHSDENGTALVLLPCPECNGCGQESCCQGHEGQPEPTDEDSA